MITKEDIKRLNEEIRLASIDVIKLTKRTDKIMSVKEWIERQKSILCELEKLEFVSHKLDKLRESI